MESYEGHKPESGALFLRALQVIFPGPSLRVRLTLLIHSAGFGSQFVEIEAASFFVRSYLRPVPLYVCA